MKIKDMLGVRILALMALSILLAVNCAEKGTPPDVNIPPNTLITGFQISATPDSGTYHSARVFWSGSDQDGAVYWYYWRIFEDTGDSIFVTVIDGADTTVVNLSMWQGSRDISASLSLDFPTFTKAYVFDVKAQDNDHTYDPTPASDTLSLSRTTENIPPMTEFSSAPPNGAATGRGIHFVVSGTDPDGTVDYFDYNVDGGSWTRVAATDNLATVDIRNLTDGERTIMFRAVDNYGVVDPTPLSVSVVVSDTFAPEVSLSLMSGQSFLVPFTNPILSELIISMSATIDFYYSDIDSFVVISSEGDTASLDPAAPEFTFTDLASGSYWINATAYDIGGNSTSTGQVDFSVIELGPDNGVLCVNGVDWDSYLSDNVAQWNAGVPWGDRTHYKIWDIFNSTPLGNLNADFTDSLLGTGSVPSWMIDTTFFEAISWFANVYSDDDLYWLEQDTTIMAYLEMGGNIYLPSRRGHFLFFDELTAYTHVASWAEDDDLGSGLTAVYAGLADITPIGGQTFSSVPTLDGSADATTLYTNPDFPGASPGFIVMPNGLGGGGKFCFIGGRNYRWDHAELKAATEFILHDLFGMPD